MKKQNITKKLLTLAIVFIAIFSVAAAPGQVLALADCTGSSTEICKSNPNLLSGVLKNVINVMIFLAGSIAVIMIVVGGIRYITSDGDPGAATKAKNTIIYALVGLVVAVMSYSIVNFVIDRI